MASKDMIKAANKQLGVDLKQAAAITKEHKERKSKLIRSIAKFLVDDQVRKGIEFSMGKPDAEAWAQIRSDSSVRGYPTVEEAVAALEQDFA